MVCLGGGSGGVARSIPGSSCLPSFHIFPPFALVSVAFHSQQPTCIPQTKKRRFNALIRNVICLKASSLYHSLQIYFSERPQQHHHTEAVFCALATSPCAHCLHVLETNQRHLHLRIQTREIILHISLVRFIFWRTVPHKVQSLNKHYQQTTDKVYLKSSLKSLAYNKIYTYKAVFLHKMQTLLIMDKNRNLIFRGSLFVMAVSEKEKEPQPFPISLFFF